MDATGVVEDQKQINRLKSVIRTLLACTELNMDDTEPETVEAIEMAELELKR